MSVHDGLYDIVRVRWLIEKRIKQRFKTQRALAEACRVSPARVSDILNCRDGRHAYPQWMLDALGIRKKTYFYDMDKASEKAASGAICRRIAPPLPQKRALESIA